MKKLIVLTALPGSGKSTWAKKYQEEHENTFIISSDEIRRELTGSYTDFSKQSEVWPLFSQRIHEYARINDNVTVILDALCDLNSLRVKYVKENPEYDYFEEHMSEPVPHKCPVCGEYEFSDALSSDICPICGWEDTGFEDTPDEKPSEYMMSFNERLVWFKEKRKTNPKYRWIKDEK